MSDNAENVEPIRPEVKCSTCKRKIFDGLVVRTRVLRVLPHGAEAKCRCGEWVRVPLVYALIPSK